MERSTRVAVIIPAYNEEKTIADIVTAARAALSDINLPGTVIVVDDGSEDETGAVAFDASAVVFTHKRKRRKGEAVRTGIQHSDTNENDIIVVFDADLLGVTKQHFHRLLAPVIHNTADMCIGTIERTVFITQLYTHIFKARVAGMRAFRRAVWDAIDFSRLSGDWDPEHPLNRAAKENGYRVATVVLSGLIHLRKEQKYGNELGRRERIGMIGRGIRQRIHDLKIRFRTFTKL